MVEDTTLLQALVVLMLILGITVGMVYWAEQEKKELLMKIVKKEG
ncbi:MAG: hypothetical protein ACE5HY_00625 [Candidatus Hydrothermarchaeales archaeon]